MMLRALPLILSLHAACLGAGCSRVLRVPFESWPPYSFIGIDQHPTGFEVELLDAIAREAGCQVSWVSDLPRKRRWLYFTTGDIDILLAGSDSATGRKAALFSRPYRQEVISAFVLDDGHEHAHTGSLHEMLTNRVPLVTQTGSDNDYPLASRFLAAGLVTRYEEYSRGLQLLQLHRGEVLIGDRWAIERAARDLQVPLRRLGFDVVKDDVAYMLSRKTLTPGDLAAIDNAIEHLTENGTLDRIRRRWLPGQ